MYIIITHNNPLQQAKDVSRELFRISRPVDAPSDVAKYLFGWVEHPTDGRVALRINQDQMIPVADDQDASALVDLLKDDASKQELLGLKELVDSSDRIRFGDIIPSVYDLKTHEEMENDGWFDYGDEL